MTKEEKRLLLVELCMRLPYGVKVNINSPIEEQNRMELYGIDLESGTIGVGNDRWAFRADPVTGKSMIDMGLAEEAPEGMYKID
jgi:hypothetical protein